MASVEKDLILLLPAATVTQIIDGKWRHMGEKFGFQKPYVTPIQEFTCSPAVSQSWGVAGGDFGELLWNTGRIHIFK